MFGEVEQSLVCERRDAGGDLNRGTANLGCGRLSELAAGVGDDRGGEPGWADRELLLEEVRKRRTIQISVDLLSASVPGSCFLSGSTDGESASGYFQSCQRRSGAIA